MRLGEGRELCDWGSEGTKFGLGGEGVGSWISEQPTVPCKTVEGSLEEWWGIRGAV